MNSVFIFMVHEKINVFKHGIYIFILVLKITTWTSLPMVKWLSLKWCENLVMHTVKVYDIL